MRAFTCIIVLSRTFKSRQKIPFMTETTYADAASKLEGFSLHQMRTADIKCFGVISMYYGFHVGHMERCQ